MSIADVEMVSVKNNKVAASKGMSTSAEYGEV